MGPYDDYKRIEHDRAVNKLRNECKNVVEELTIDDLLLLKKLFERWNRFTDLWVLIQNMLNERRG